MTIAAVVPAAGKSERFGSQKLLADVDGRPLLARTIDSLVAGGAGDVIVVTADNSPEVADPRVRRVANPDPSRGMFSSIQTGVIAAPVCDVLLVLPADMPFVQSATVETVARACAATATTTVPVFEGKRGHPVAMPPSVRHAVASADLSLTLKQVLERFEIAEVAVSDPGVLRDVDRPQDLT